MADKNQVFYLQELPGHLIMEVLTSGQLSAADLAKVELTCRMFGSRHEFCPDKFISVAEYSAYCICHAHKMFALLPLSAKGTLLSRCGGNWKKVLRFLQSIEQSSSLVNTSSGKMQVDTGKYHTLLIHNSSLYSCGSNLCGVLGHGHHKTQCATFSRINFPSLSPVINVSASHNHAAFVTQSGEVFTCGDNSSFCCGHGDIGRTVFKPTRIEALRNIPCKQVATGLSFTIILTTKGRVYTCGNNSHGQLGQGDTTERLTPALVHRLVDPVDQVTAGTAYSMVVTGNGSVYSFGSCNNFCLGHGEQSDELAPREIGFFKKKGMHVVRVSAGDEHVLAIDSSGYVYSWGRGYCGALGHGNQNDKAGPELISALKGQIAVQVCARKRKTFVLTDEGCVFAFGWMGFGSLGFSNSITNPDKILKPRLLDSLCEHVVSQISTGLYHTVAVTNRGVVFGFGDNERAQLGHEWLRGCLNPTEIVVRSGIDVSV